MLHMFRRFFFLDFKLVRCGLDVFVFKYFFRWNNFHMHVYDIWIAALSTTCFWIDFDPIRMCWIKCVFESIQFVVLPFTFTFKILASNYEMPMRLSAEYIWRLFTYLQFMWTHDAYKLDGFFVFILLER